MNRGKPFEIQDGGGEEHALVIRMSCYNKNGLVVEFWSSSSLIV